MISINFTVDKYIKEYCELILEENLKDLEKCATKEIRSDIDRIHIETTKEWIEKYEKKLKVMADNGKDYMYEHKGEIVPYEIGDYIFSNKR